MMQIRCQWCGWTYTMARETLLYAVARAQAEKAIHYSDNCPKCRRALKIQVSELKRRIPPGTQLPDVTTQPDAAPSPVAAPAPEPVKEEKKKAPAETKAEEAKPAKQEKKPTEKKTPAAKKK